MDVERGGDDNTDFSRQIQPPNDRRKRFNETSFFENLSSTDFQVEILLQFAPIGIPR